jgi:hypothetical protein
MPVLGGLTASRVQHEDEDNTITGIVPGLLVLDPVTEATYLIVSVESYIDCVLQTRKEGRCTFVKWLKEDDVLDLYHSEYAFIPEQSE